MKNTVEYDTGSAVEAVINTPTGPWLLQFAEADEDGLIRLGMQGPNGRAAMAITPDELESFAMGLVKLANEVRE